MHQQKVKASLKALRTLKEIERELKLFGLTNQGAAAIVRFANTLKSVRKLRASHILLLTPGRRLHPPSPLSQHVWNQDEIEDELPASDGLLGEEETEDASSAYDDETFHSAEEVVTFDFSHDILPEFEDHFGRRHPAFSLKLKPRLKLKATKSDDLSNKNDNGRG
ncbi:hypothetical protein A9Z42_0010110 [Trichoderma parareesei]|uniref:Uncharacterized protein n=1 Tax=Trichoderma parareesei TaxID=858221 RepID=A0A2H2ZN13_TRIPA|nr:hypothetical protein A9Z42_0010110 [Trichoderma parareesei]